MVYEMSASPPSIDLRPDHWDIVRETLQRHVPDRSVLAFGSRATWTAWDYSDLDIAIMGKVPLPQSTLWNLKEEFVESELPFRVDIVEFARLEDDFRGIVRAHGVPIQSPEHEEWQSMSFFEAVVINPEVHLERGKAYPFVNMATIDAGVRSVCALVQRIYSGGGSRFQSGDTLMARITPCLENGKIARYQSNQNLVDAYGSTEFIVIRGRTDVTDSNYAYYLTRWDKVRNYAVDQMTGTSGRQRVPVDSLKYLSVPVPPLPEQRAIAHILGTLDEKIELNRRMNQTLEAISRTIFKDWFVDFGPVRAKMEGRDPYLPSEIWELFPDRFVDSELGDIPKGWEVKKLKECINLTMGQSPPGSTYNDRKDGLPFFQGSSEFDFRYAKKRRYCSSPTRLAMPEDTLVSVRAPVGDINMAWERCCIGRGLASLRHKSGSGSFTYYFTWALQSRLREYKYDGTVFGAINKNQFENLVVVEPDSRIVAEFDSIAANMDRRIRVNVSESHKLTASRDVLLPKLLSGDVRAHTLSRLFKEIHEKD